MVFKYFTNFHVVSFMFYHLVDGASTILNRSVGRVRHWGVPTSAQAAGSMVRKDVFVNEPHPPQIRLAVWWEYSMGVDGHPPLRWQSSHCPLILDTHLAPTMWTKIDWTMASGFWCFFSGNGIKIWIRGMIDGVEWCFEHLVTWLTAVWDVLKAVSHSGLYIDKALPLVTQIACLCGIKPEIVEHLLWVVVQIGGLIWPHGP